MQRYVQHEFLKVSHFSCAEWPHPLHNHNHFELIFIHQGSGFHCLSGMKYPYAANSLFLLHPADYHSFEISTLTTFTFIKFNSAYITQIGHLPPEHHWNRNMDELLVCSRRQELPIIKLPTDAEKIDALLRLLVREWKETANETNETIFFLLQSVMSIIRRNMHEPADAPIKQQEKITQIVHYIHQHIYNAADTRQEHLAALFGFSARHLGAFFREQMQVPLRDYINQYKLHIIENRLKYSSLSLKEISEELGFADLSHFNKFFKGHHKINPSQYRGK
jgi:AraC-like DNA-binding protein